MSIQGSKCSAPSKVLERAKIIHLSQMDHFGLPVAIKREQMFSSIKSYFKSKDNPFIPNGSL
jgi:hypothetical protein